MSLQYMNDLRRAEVRAVIERHGAIIRGRRVLEIGSGTGVQLQQLASVASEVVGVEVENATYGRTSDPRIVIYDGHRLPFEDGSFDVVFSSNVLEHVAHQDAFQREIMRVLRREGRCIHILPSHLWKFWYVSCSLAAFPLRLAKRLSVTLRARRWAFPVSAAGWLDLAFGERHGEIGGRFGEFFAFRPAAWLGRFARAGWVLEGVEPGGFAYEGNMLLANRLSLSTRASLARWIGSACYVFVLRRPSSPECS